MKAVIMQFPYGLMAFGEDNSLVDKVIFPKSAQAAAKTVFRLESGKLSKDLQTLINSLQKGGYTHFAFDDPSLAELVKDRLSVQIEVLETSESESLRSHSAHLAVELGFVKDDQELDLWTRRVTMELAKMQVKGETEKRDLVVGQAIQTLDDLDRTLNLFMGRLREWYGVHFPELDRLVEKHETYARLVLDLGSKDNFTVHSLEKLDLPKSKTEQIGRIAGSSMGADIMDVDLVPIQDLSRQIVDMYKLRDQMETYLDNTMSEVAPNTQAIVGSLLGARLIAIAGGLENLAKRPASTMQVLGAEKALFRSLKTGARPPKHGLIFQHTLLHDAKRWQRGKIARALAGKLAIAVRADAYGGNYVGDRLKASLNKRIEEIRQKYPEPPPIKEQKPPMETHERRFRPSKERGKGGGYKGREERRRGKKWRKNIRAGKS